MDVIRLRGNSEEIGQQHGTCLREKIAATWEFYSQILFGNQLELLETYGLKYLEAVRSFSGEYAAEMEGIAAGAGLAAWQISALNARTEIFHIVMEQMLAGECTTFYYPGTRILGQNWDWMEQLESLFVVMEIERPDGHKILQITEPGIIGKIGLNSRGVGTCLNIITGGASEVGVPVHVLMRAVLDSDTLDQVLERYNNMRHGTCSSITMADDSGRSVMLEFSGATMAVVDFESAIPMRTNHFLSRLKEGRDNSTDFIYPNSIARYERAAELLNGRDGNGELEEFMAVLRDTKNENDPICARYKDTLGLMIGTVSSIVMDLPARTLHFTTGNPADNPYQQVSI